MKKLLIALSICMLASTAIAANWQEFKPKMYYDLNTIKTQDGEVWLWEKALNGSYITPSIPNIKGKRIWFVVSKIDINCSSRKLSVDKTYYYDLDGKMVYESSYDLQNRDIIPGSGFEDAYFNVFCSVNNGVY